MALSFQKSGVPSPVTGSHPSVAYRHCQIHHSNAPVYTRTTYVEALRPTSKIRALSDIVEHHADVLGIEQGVQKAQRGTAVPKTGVVQ